MSDGTFVAPKSREVPGGAAATAGFERGSIRRNLAANFVGSGWMAAATIVAVPLYIRFLGVETYGLIGLFGVLVALTSVLDFGTGAALTRELARGRGDAASTRGLGELARTLETMFWCVGGAAGLAIALAAPWIAAQWLKTDAVPLQTVTAAIRLMGLVFFVQWPSNLYAAGLLGMERQIAMNVIGAASATMRVVGAVLVLWRFPHDVRAFFAWQAIASALHTFVIAGAFWQGMPASARRSRVRLQAVVEVGRFAAGVTGIMTLAAVLTQMDKVVVSRLLTLEQFGYYSVAGVAAGSLYRLAGPVFAAAYPRLIHLVTSREEIEEAALYHRTTQLVAVLVIPVALVIASFPSLILSLWVRNPDVVKNASSVLALLAIGAALRALGSVPYALQLAHAWTRLSFLTNAVSIVVLLPVLILVTQLFGAVGAAATWLLFNTGGLVVYVSLMHRRVLRTEVRRWYVIDVGLPGLAASAVVLAGRLLIDPHVEHAAVMVGIVGVMSLTAAAFAAPEVRKRRFVWR